jgi:hypothetical protein
MTEMMIMDTATVSSRRKTRAGYLVAQCRVAKAGNIQVYTGAEAGMPTRDHVRIYRPPETVFDADTMRGWAFKPITYQHPRAGSVTSQNWRDEAVGVAGGEVLRDGDYVTVPMCLMDAATIDAVESDAATEVSCGYRVALDASPGTTPEGEPYDAKVSRILPDHIAIVPKGRAGSDCRFGDGEPQAANDVPAPPTTTGERPIMADIDNGRAVILVDGFTVTTTPQGVEAIKKLQAQLQDTHTLIDGERASHKDVVASLNDQLAQARQAKADAEAARDGEIAGLKLTHQQALDAANAKVAELEAAITPAALDARVAQRAEVLAVARRFFGDDFSGEGMSDSDVRKATVVKAMGPTLADADSKPELFFDHVFEVVKAQPTPQTAPKPDPLRTAIQNGGGAVALDAAKEQQRQPSAFERNRAMIENAWKHTAPVNGAH